MTENLVKQLRDYEKPGITMPLAADRIEQLEELQARSARIEFEGTKVWRSIADERADRIEQLEAALRGVIAVADRNCPEFRAAHAALAGEKKDG